ncbi:MAG: DUF4340 domain-containing protein [Chroococcidiopsidaceae cyanobacterium CP_BM_RX_35]|nr:DUF4340 domain-containing protein [Chroococcidiopsidaceae cyanobacterium CP_BM_RX_35]
MRLKRTTLILLLLASGLGGFVYFYEVQGANQRQEAEAQEQQIFSFTVDQIQSLTVKTKQRTLLLERQDKPSQSRWLMKAPIQTSASDAAISYLTDLLVQGKSERTLQVPASQLQEYGLAQSQATIEVRLKDQKTHRLVLGKPDFNKSFLYAQVDPPAQDSGNMNVVLVSTEFNNALDRPLSEWKSQNADQGNSSKPQLKIPSKVNPSASP